MAQSTPSVLSLSRYAPDAKSLVSAAQSLADERQHAEVEPVHLLARALERYPAVAEVFRRAGSNPIELQTAAEAALSRFGRSQEPSYLSAAMLDLQERAERERQRERATSVELGHLLNALSQEIRGAAGEIFSAFGISPGGLRDHLSVLQSGRWANTATARSGAAVAGQFTRDLLDRARNDEDPVVGRESEIRRLLTILERRNKSHPILIGEPGVGKAAIVRALAKRLAGGDVPTSLASTKLFEIETAAIVAGARLRGEIEERMRGLLGAFTTRGEDSILVARNLDQLFGQGAVGSAIGELLRPALERGDVRLLATTTPEGWRRIEERDPALLRLLTPLPVEEPSQEAAIEIVRAVAGTYERHHQVQISDPAVVAAVRLAKRYVPERFLPDSALDLLDEAAAYKRVDVDGVPPELDDAIRRLQSIRAQLASLEHADDEASVATRARLAAEAEQLKPRVEQISASIEARRGAVAAVRTLQSELEQARASARAARDAGNLGRAGEIEHVEVPELQARLAKAEGAARSLGAVDVAQTLGEEDVAKTLARWTGVPIAKMLEGEAEKLLRMEERLGQRVIGQDHAAVAIARAVRRGRVGLRDPRRPIGSFLFLGPSGVGKTELAKALAEFLFDDEHALTRHAMSEFKERHMAQRLLGAPPGYVDSEQGGFLTEAVRRRPYSVLLFDEVEKAHQDVFNLLLQVLDDGRLTDARGRLADFSNTVVIMTSNIGSGRILEADPKLFETSDGRDALRDVLLDELRGFFRPEFLNRIDDVVVFRSLDRADLRKIVDIQLRGLERLLSDRHLTLAVTDAAKDRLVELGYEPGLGARPLRRAILRHLQDPLAEALLRGEHQEQGRLRVDVDEHGFRIEPATD